MLPGAGPNQVIMTVPKGPEAGPGRQYRVANGEQKLGFAYIHRERILGSSETATRSRNGVAPDDFCDQDHRLERLKSCQITGCVGDGGREPDSVSCSERGRYEIDSACYLVI